MRRLPKKLSLHRDTLGFLDRPELQQAAGGVSLAPWCKTNFLSCPECNPPG
jgi:hypothetical protein